MGGGNHQQKNKLWNKKVIATPIIVIGVLGAVQKNLERIMKTGDRERIDSVQTLKLTVDVGLKTENGPGELMRLASIQTPVSVWFGLVWFILRHINSYA